MYKIFIVEDDRAMAEAMGERLTAWGHQVCFAVNFQDVLGGLSGLPAPSGADGHYAALL